MRLAFVLVAVILCFADLSQAQPEVRDERKGMMVGVRHAFVMTMAGTESSYLEKQWKSFMTKYGKLEKIKKTNTWLLQSAHLVDYPDIDRVNVFSEVMTLSEDPDLVVWIETDSIFINSSENPKAWEAGIELLHEFAFKVKLDQISTEIETEDKVLQKLKNELSKLESSHDKYVQTIDRSHKAIADAESDIVVNQRDQESTTTSLDSYNDLENNPDAQKAVKKLERKMTQLQKQNMNYYNDIARNKDRITQNEANIVQNDADQEAKNLEIEEKEAHLSSIRNRLNAVRAGDYNEGN